MIRLSSYSINVLRTSLVLLSVLLTPSCIVTLPGASIGASQRIASLQQQIAEYDRAIADYNGVLDNQKKVIADLQALKASHTQVVDGVPQVSDERGLLAAIVKAKALATAGGHRSSEFGSLPPGIKKEIDSFESFNTNNAIQGTVLAVSAAKGTLAIAMVNTEILRSTQISERVKKLISLLQQQRVAAQASLAEAERSLRPTTSPPEPNTGGDGGGGSGGGGGGGGTD